MRIYYHNITQDQTNNSCWLEFLEVHKEGDVCYKSESGNACIRRITDDDLKELKKRYTKYLTENEWI